MKNLDPAEIGRWGENAACAFLRLKGFKILDRNYKAGHRELDIIASDRGEIVFVEVKVRCRSDYGGPLCAVDWRKQRDLTRAAVTYLLSTDNLIRPCRFDVVGILIDEKGRGMRLRHVRDAFNADTRPGLLR